MEIYLDENLSEYVADALNSLNKGYFTEVLVFSTKIKFGKGAADETIIPALGKTGSVLITRDLNIQRTQILYQLCGKYKLGVFFLKLPKGSDRHWELTKLLLNNWEEIIVRARKEKRPYGYEIGIRGKMRKI